MKSLSTEDQPETGDKIDNKFTEFMVDDFIVLEEDEMYLTEKEWLNLMDTTDV